MVVKMALYGLKSLGAAFRAKLSGVIHGIGYTLSKAEPDVWLRPAVKPDGAEYYEMIICYVDQGVQKRKEDIPIGYQQIKCHMIFDVKLGDKFRRKARLVVGGHTTTAPASIT